MASWGLLALLAMRRSRYHAVILARYSPEYAALLAPVAALAALVTAAGWAPVSGLLTRVRHKLALLAVSILLSLAMLEGLVRVLDPLGASFYEEVKRYQLILRPDPLLIYVQPPGHRSVYGGVEVAVNELGLRERPLAPRAPGARRVLVLGDSVVFGWGVPADQTFARRLEPELRGRLGQPVETINSGVPGYNTVMEMQFLKRHGEALDPDAVVLVYVDNDVEVALPLPRDLGASPPPLSDPVGWSEHLLAKLWVYRLAYHLGPLLVPSQPSVGDDARAAVGWQASMGALAGIAGWCRERNVPLAVALYRPVAGPLTDALREEIARVAARERFEFVDTLPWFAGLRPREVTVSFVDVHPNTRGHAIIARGLAEAMVSSGMARRMSTR